MGKPPVDVSLHWTQDLVFETQVASGRGPILDGDGASGASPVQALALALGSCMGVDVVMILKKGRHDLRGLKVTVVGERAEGPPSRVTAYAIRFEVTGPVPEAAIERAIALSRATYCSVWHSLPLDTPLEITYARIDG